ncbi:hypothetical protein GUJ93_ZPchr0010g8355 [Zizania palustris]|uniref:Uncharacterized protein n=1 Tax=Zizania palustris TaxID=103762 RepID=A0A8J6BL92_ZIZPA|nr:hypothetical protein GUJ93_ZPchr0010g8355 [Zizania palustris]
MSKSSITKAVTKSDEGIRKNASFPKSLEISNLADGNGISQDAMICSKEAIPVSHMNPLDIPTMCDDPSDSVADGVKQDPSECSVDSPCWRGASVSHLSSFDVLQTSAPQSINEEPEVFGDEQKESTTIVQRYEALEMLQNFEQSHSQSHLELGVSMKSGDIGKNNTNESHEKGLESAKQCAAKCTAEQKTNLGIRESSMKRSGLNSAAPDFIPSSVGKLKISEGSCSSSGSNISGILKAIENLSEMLQNSFFFDEIELEDHDHTILRSVIENLQTCLHKTRKGPIKDGTSNKAGLRAPHSQTAVFKSDAGSHNGSYTANGGNSITNNNFAGTSHVLNDFGKNSLHWSQPSVNNITRRISCEEDHSQILIYKNLWIDAERANCELKYLLKHTRMKTDPESSMAHVGSPRNPSSHSCNSGADCSDTCGAAISCPPTLCFPKGHPTEETSIVRNTGLLYTGDDIQLGGDGVFSCSARTDNHPIRTKNFQGGLVLTKLEETSMCHHAHPVPQLAPSRAHRELKRSTMDQASGSSCITGVESVLHGNSEYGLLSDWEHVPKEEIGWS